MRSAASFQQIARDWPRVRFSTRFERFYLNITSLFDDVTVVSFSYAVVSFECSRRKEK